MQKNNYPGIGETVYSETLPNGLRVYIIPKPGFITSYAVFGTNYGGVHRRFVLDGQEKNTPAGVAHFLEHKMFDLPNGDNALNILSSNGAQPNAFTSSGVTCYYFQSTDSFYDNLRMLLHFVSTPYFTEETVDKEQGIISQEILMGEDNPIISLYYNLMKLLYPSHPVAERVAGTVESISHITAQTLYDCHKAFYSPSNMALCVEGDIDPQRVVDIALEVLPGEKAAVPKVLFDDDGRLVPAEHRRCEQMEVSAPQFYIGARLRSEKDGRALMLQQLISELAMKVLVGQSSPFYTRLYAEGILNQDFDYETDFTAGTATVLVGGESQEPDRVLEELLKEVEAVGRNGLSPAAFDRARRASIGSRLRGLEDFDNVCTSTVMSDFDGIRFFDAFEALEEVTIDDCSRFLTENLTRERLAISIIEPKKD